MNKSNRVLDARVRAVLRAAFFVLACGAASVCLAAGVARAAAAAAGGSS
ncbi:MAG: hypothetical protein H0T60_07985, partial [Acidobacteria bacterium]|nr:hypothetical protein [Acidobacteriota bacterium]